MSFLYKLFPFKSLYRFDDSTITAFWVLTTILLFLFFLLKYNKKIYLLTSNLSTMLELNEKLIETMDEKYGDIWKLYSSHFIQINHINKSYNSFQRHLSLEYLLSKQNLNLNFILSIPNKMVGIGILGTFVGLTYGISDFRTDSTQQIEKSINILLSGMGTAFVSSIWGMILSLIYSYVEKQQFNRLRKKITKLCEKIDEIYLITKKEEIEIEIKKIAKSIESHFEVVDENGNKIRPGNVLRDLYLEAEKQTAALKSFSTDLAVTIQAGFETILNNEMQKSIVPLIEKITEELELLRLNIKDPAGEMTTAVVNNLEKVMADMIQEFKFSVSGSTKAELENITQILSSTVINITEIPGLIKDSTIEMTKLIDSLSISLNSNIGSIQTEQYKLINKQNENINLTDNLYSNLKDAILELNNTTNKIDQTQNVFQNSFEKFKSLSSNISDLVLTNQQQIDTILQISKYLGESTKDYTEKNKQIIFKTNEILHNVIATSKNISEEYGEIKSGLISIFAQIQKGINDYNLVIDNALRNNLQAFADAMTQSTNSLNGTMTGLQDIMNDLTEQIEKFNQTKRI